VALREYEQIEGETVDVIKFYLITDRGLGDNEIK
jgi:hypothetical protein